MKWAVAILVTTLIAVLLTGYILPDKDLQVDLSNKLLRFHVIANSDDEADQQLKLKVKDAIVEYLDPYLTAADSKNNAMVLINSKLNDIQRTAEEVIKEEGYEYPVKVSIGKFDFPVKSYGAITLPSGEYDALRIVIGKGDGKNWWCVLFPPLCFVDTAHGKVRDNTKEELSRVLSKNEIEEISSDRPEIKFKAVEIVENIASKVSDTLKLAFQKRPPD